MEQQRNRKSSKQALVSQPLQLPQCQGHAASSEYAEGSPRPASDLACGRIDPDACRAHTRTEAICHRLPAATLFDTERVHISWACGLSISPTRLGLATRRRTNSSWSSVDTVSKVCGRSGFMHRPGLSLGLQLGSSPRPAVVSGLAGLSSWLLGGQPLCQCIGDGACAKSRRLRHVYCKSTAAPKITPNNSCQHCRLKCPDVPTTVPGLVATHRAQLFSTGWHWVCCLPHADAVSLPQLC